MGRADYRTACGIVLPVLLAGCDYSSAEPPQATETASEAASPSTAPTTAAPLDTDRTIDIAARVRTVVAEQLGVAEGDVTPEASFVDDLGADSLDSVELALAFEEEFGVDIADAEAEGVRTVGDAIDLMVTLTAADER